MINKKIVIFLAGSMYTCFSFGMEKEHFNKYEKEINEATQLVHKAHNKLLKLKDFALSHALDSPECQELLRQIDHADSVQGAFSLIIASKMRTFTAEVFFRYLGISTVSTKIKASLIEYALKNADTPIMNRNLKELEFLYTYLSACENQKSIFTYAELTEPTDTWIPTEISDISRAEKATPLLITAANHGLYRFILSMPKKLDLSSIELAYCILTDHKELEYLLCVELLIRHCENNKITNFFHPASTSNAAATNLPMLINLVGRGFSICANQENNVCPLHSAILRQKPATTSYLLAQIPDPQKDLNIYMCILTERGSIYFTPLHIAIKNCDHESVQMLLNAGADTKFECRYEGKFYDAKAFAEQLMLENYNENNAENWQIIINLLS